MRASPGSLFVDAIYCEVTRVQLNLATVPVSNSSIPPVNLHVSCLEGQVHPLSSVQRNVIVGGWEMSQQAVRPYLASQTLGLEALGEHARF